VIVSQMPCDAGVAKDGLMKSCLPIRPMMGRDPAKRSATLAERGLDFADAARMFERDAVTVPTCAAIMARSDA
jgi:hypothetical protein